MKDCRIMLNKGIATVLLIMFSPLAATADDIIADGEGYTQIDGEIAGALYRLSRVPSRTA